MYSEQILAARAMCRWRQKDLAQVSGVSLSTIKKIELKRGTVETTVPILECLIRAFNSVGVEFGDDCHVSYRKSITQS